jgi:DNA primase
MKKIGINEVKLKISPSRFYKRELNISMDQKNRVWTIGGRCPFHSDKRAGSFFINQKSGAFKCFSCGAKGGDIISFICDRYTLSIPQALERLNNDF